MSQHRGRGGRATDGKRGWRIDNVDYVGGGPPDYTPPHDPLGPLPADEHNKRKSNDPAGCCGCMCGATAVIVGLIMLDILVRLLH